MNKDNKIAYIKSVISNMGEIDLSNDNHSTLPRIKNDEVSYHLPMVMYEYRVEVLQFLNSEEVIGVDYIEYENLPDHVIEQLLHLVQNWEEVQMTSK